MFRLASVHLRHVSRYKNRLKTIQAHHHIKWFHVSATFLNRVAAQFPDFFFCLKATMNFSIAISTTSCKLVKLGKAFLISLNYIACCHDHIVLINQPNHGVWKSQKKSHSTLASEASLSEEKFWQVFDRSHKNWWKMPIFKL